jgi:hypothetical protein
MSATHRYVVRGDEVFFVVLDLRRYAGGWFNGKCGGTRARVLTRRGGPGARVACPVCGLVCAITTRNEVMTHYWRTPARVESDNRQRRAAAARVT